MKVQQVYEYRGKEEQPTKKGWYIYHFECANGVSNTIMSKDNMQLEKGKLYVVDFSINGTGFLDSIKPYERK